MNAASRELCRELYELSLWTGTYFTWYVGPSGLPELLWHEVADGIPAYDLGYLLRKLPAFIDESNYQLTLSPTNLESWNTGYIYDGEWLHGIGIMSTDTPEDAAAMLAIELFKRGVLQRETL